MLQLRDIKKSYVVGDMTTEALKGVSVDFRKSEFVAILGPSGCGKTTLLNVIGGLDQYTSGDLIINGRSTKEYDDSDWDFYRNHSIGFVFQSYNLIPHQTVLANVELALTLSGVSKSERKAKALEALGKVGIADQAKKKPNQLSGGQMQRVAIARALVNNPDILLADEPTGALDTATSVQIMELLKEISKDKLVIMVTHNPELANDYATRIVNLKDGEIISDGNPVPVEKTEAVTEQKEVPKKKKKEKKKKTSMSFLTALSLSLNNLMTKKTRTMLTSFAGSIGIIGIALILSLSSGFKAYINKVQEDTLSTYPIQITKETLDTQSMMEELSGNADSEEYQHDMDKIYARPIFGKIANSFASGIKKNDLKAFKEYLDSNKDTLDEYTTDIKYTYGIELDVYSKNTADSIVKVNPMKVFEELMGGAESPMFSSSDVWNEMLDNQELLDSQYDVVKGRWPEKYNEVVLFVDERNEINDYILCGLGLIDQATVNNVMQDLMNGKTISAEMTSYTYEEILDLEFSLVPSSYHYVQNKETGAWEDKGDDYVYMKEQIDNNGIDIKIVGIMRPKESAVATSASSMIGYTHALTEHCITLNNQSDIVKYQNEHSDINAFTGAPFVREVTMEDIYAAIEQIPDEKARNEFKAQIDGMMQQMPEEKVIEIVAPKLFKDANGNTDGATLEKNLIEMGAAELDTPSSINIYVKDFEAKDFVASFIDDYNANATEDGKEDKVIHYTDYVGIMMSSISTIIDIISYVLIAFVSISLVVSSIMIGIITYISVLERTKEIGILRAIGASKKDITRVFNAETIIVGFTSGTFGILITMLLNIPINMIIKALGDIENVSKLPIWGAIALVVISMLLTWIAGLIPSRIASKKDPVVALRTE